MKYYSAKLAIYYILTVKEQVIRVYGNESKYKAFLDFIFARDYAYDENLSIPSMKEIGNAIGMKYPKLFKLIRELYDNLFYDEENDFSFDFKNVEVYFRLQYNNQIAEVKCSRLAYLPRLGEQVSMCFASAKIGEGFFYVDFIDHSFEGDTQKIYITLRSGISNTYIKYRRDKAFMEKEMTDKQYFHSDDYDTKELLKIGRYR
tara:strand:+ start:90 stop:698 length:609 start_codon:yes stop_codon:yes gene_type:complete